MNGKQTAIPSSDDACLSIVRSLMCYRVGGENEKFNMRAIESLVKKLKEKRDELDSLITAVTTSGTQPGKCVTIERTLDGRLQVAGRKGFPHVMYAKIWRWSDVHRNEMCHIKICKYGFDLKCDSVCVNPYHYNRFDRVIPTRINHATFDIKSIETSSIGENDDESNGNNDSVHRNINEECSSRMEEDINRIQTIAYHSTMQAAGSNNVYNSQCYEPYIPIVVEQQRQHNTDSQNKTSGADVNYTLRAGNSSCDQKVESYNENANILISSLHANDNQNAPMTSTMKCEQYLQYQRDFSNALVQYPQQALVAHNNNIIPRQQDNTHTLNYSHRDNHDADSRPGETKRLLSNQPAPEFWCSIAYFESDVQIGEVFKVKSCYPLAIVDGFTDPDRVNRFSLGALSNVHRTDKSEITRKYIGRGVILELHNEGDVWLKCESDYSVFVQSHYLDEQAGRASGFIVHKIHPAAHIKVFDLHKCYSHIKFQVATAQAATAAQAAAVSGQQTHSSSTVKNISATGGVGVDDLRRLCILRLSFVKGWGPDYPRHSIKETPCWIEVNLFRALQLLDEVLNTAPIKKLQKK